MAGDKGEIDAGDDIGAVAGNGTGTSVAGDDALIGNYLSRVRKAAWYLPSKRRDWVVAEIGDRIAAAIESEDPGAQDTTAMLAGFGDPKNLVRAVDGHIPGTEARWMEFTAIGLLLLGGALWSIFWLVGVVLVWTSPRWRWHDKLLASLVWPGGLLAARLLMTRYAVSSALFAGGGFVTHGRSSFRYVIDTTLGYPPLRHLLVLLLVALPPVLVAIRLLRRARQPERPQVPREHAGLKVEEAGQV